MLFLEFFYLSQLQLMILQLRELESCLVYGCGDILQEMIIDQVDSQNVPRYLVYDIVKFEVRHVSQLARNFPSSCQPVSTEFPIVMSAS